MFFLHISSSTSFTFHSTLHQATHINGTQLGLGRKPTLTWKPRWAPIQILSMLVFVNISARALNMIKRLAMYIKINRYLIFSFEVIRKVQDSVNTPKCQLQVYFGGNLKITRYEVRLTHAVRHLLILKDDNDNILRSVDFFQDLKPFSNF